MPEVKVGDVVRYSVQGKSYNALVLYARSGQVDYLGEDEEPLLHLAFVAPERESASARAKLGYIPQVFVEYDVVHASHEFSEQFRREHNLQTEAQIATKRGAGEWEELTNFDEEAFSALSRTIARLREEKAALEATAPPPAMFGGNQALPPAAPPAPPLHEAPVNEPTDATAPDSPDQEN